MLENLCAPNKWQSCDQAASISAPMVLPLMTVAETIIEEEEEKEVLKEEKEKQNIKEEKEMEKEIAKEEVGAVIPL